jgi:hypothetical protein
MLTCAVSVITSANNNASTFVINAKTRTSTNADHPEPKPHPTTRSIPVNYVIHFDVSGISVPVFFVGSGSGRCTSVA